MIRLELEIGVVKISVLLLECSSIEIVIVDNGTTNKFCLQSLSWQRPQQRKQKHSQQARLYNFEICISININTQIHIRDMRSAFRKKKQKQRRRLRE